METHPKSIDFYKHVSVHVKSLQILGLWFYIPYQRTSIWFWLHVLVRIVCGFLFLTVPPLGQIAYVVKLLASGNFEIQHVASSINLILTELLISLKLADMLYRRELLTQLIDQLVNGEFHRTTHRNILESAIKLSRRLFWCLLCGTTLDVFFHMVVVPGLGEFQTLPVKMDLIFIDANEPPYFDYVCFYQIIYKPFLVLAYIALQTLPWALLSFAIAQLDILIDNFKHMESLVEVTKAERRCGENEAYKEVFNGFLLHHRAIINFLDTTEAAFSGQLALTLILSSFIICFTGVQFFAIESPSKNLVPVFWVMTYWLIFVMIIFTDCYFGNSIYVKGSDLATVAYGSPWLKMPQELKKNLVLVIARAQKPLVITAYKLVPITLPTFTKVQKYLSNLVRNNKIVFTFFDHSVCAHIFELQLAAWLAIFENHKKVMNWTYKAFAVMNGMKK